MKKFFIVLLILLLLFIPMPPDATEHETDIIVKLYDSATREEKRAVREATKFWEEYHNEVNFIKHYRIKKPDVIIVFVGFLTRCGERSSPNFIGCAPQIDLRKHKPRDTMIIRIQRLDYKMMLGTTKHELGHILGKSHKDPPEDIMDTGV